MRFDGLVAAAALCVWPVASAAQPAVQPQKISTADFASLPAMRRPILSPNGKLIAARASSDDATKLVILDTDKPGQPLRVINVGKGGIANLVWAGNQRILLTIQSSQEVRAHQRIPFLRLIAIDVATGAARFLDRRSRGIYAGDVLYTDPTGSWALVAGQDDMDVYPSVKKVDLATGDEAVVEKARDGVWDWYADERGVVRAGLAYDDAGWTLWYREDPAEKLRKLRGKFDKGDSAVDRFFFGQGDTGWIVTNERTGRFALYRYDFKNDAIGAAVFENPKVDIDDVIADPVTGEITGVSYEDDKFHTWWLDPERQKIQERIDHALPLANNRIVGGSNDMQKLLVWSGGAADPGRYFLYDRHASTMHAVVDPYPEIDPAKLSAVTATTYAARDGLEIPAYLTLPKGRDAKGLPLVIMPHGGPFERDDWEYDPIVQFLANRGYAVLQPEFRGSTGYGKGFVEKGYGEWGRKMQDDLDDGVDWLVKTGKVDPRRVCIVGLSYGGYAALWGAVRNPDRYRCAASMAGISDLEAQLRYNRKEISAPRYYREWRTKVAGEGKINLSSVSPIAFADRIKVPLLIAHGEDDETVLPRQSHEMVDAVSKANGPVTSVFYRNTGHEFGSSANLQDFLQRLETFLAKYNPA